MSETARGYLVALIDHLGLSQREAAALLGIGEAALARKLAGKARYDVRGAEIATLRTLADRLDQDVAAAVRSIEALPKLPDETRPEITILIYRRDEDLPPWSGYPYASLHRRMVSRVARAINGLPVLFDAAAYAAWRGAKPDDQQTRAEWAASRPDWRLGVIMAGKSDGTAALGWAAIEIDRGARIVGKGTLPLKRDS